MPYELCTRHLFYSDTAINLFNRCICHIMLFLLLLWCRWSDPGDTCKLNGEIQIKRINTLRPGQNGRHCPDDISKCNFLNVNVLISIKVSHFVSEGPINNIPTSARIFVLIFFLSQDTNIMITYWITYFHLNILCGPVSIRSALYWQNTDSKSDSERLELRVAR